jgi:hypothetical protein
MAVGIGRNQDVDFVPIKQPRDIGVLAVVLQEIIQIDHRRFRGDHFAAMDVGH